MATSVLRQQLLKSMALQPQQALRHQHPVRLFRQRERVGRCVVCGFKVSRHFNAENVAISCDAVRAAIRSARLVTRHG